MQDISAWLKSNKDYEIGLSLYMKYGQSGFLKKTFASGPSPFNTKQLESELRKLAPATPATINPVIPKSPDRKVIPEIPSITKIPHFDREVQLKYLRLKDEQKSLYRQLERNMAMLDLEEDEKILHRTAKEIIGLHEKIQKIFYLLDFYDEEGKFPADKKKSAPVTSEYDRIHSSLSRARKRLESPRCRDRKATEKLIQKKEARLIEIKEGNP